MKKINTSLIKLCENFHNIFYSQTFSESHTKFLYFVKAYLFRAVCDSQSIYLLVSILEQNLNFASFSS